MRPSLDQQPSIGFAPSEALLLARAILGQSPASCMTNEGGGAVDWEQLEWLAAISSEHGARLRRLAQARQADPQQRAQLQWLAEISTERRGHLQDLLCEEAAAAEVRERARRCIENLERAAEDWDSAKHPRLGGPPNAGWFASTGGSMASTSSGASAVSKPDAFVLPDGHQYLAQVGAAAQPPAQGGQRGSTSGDDRPGQPAAAGPAAAQPAAAATQFNAALRGFLKALNPYVARWWDKHGKLVRRDATSFFVMWRQNSDFQIESSGGRDVYVYYVSDKASALEVALSIVNEFYTPNTNHWHGPAATFPNPFDRDKDEAQQFADWQKKAFKVGAAQAALLSQLYVYGVLSFNAGADAVVNVSDALERGLSVGSVIGATTLLGAIIAHGKGGALVLRFGATEVNVAGDAANAFGKLPAARQAEIADQVAKAGEKAAPGLFARLVREASGLAKPVMTSWGWSGSNTWLEAVRRVGKGGTIESIVGKVPKKQEAIDLIRAADGTIDRIEGAHTPPNPHQYPHVNYTTSDGAKGTLRYEQP